MEKNVLLLLQMSLQLLSQTQVITTLIAKARSEGRDVTEEELKELFSADDVAKAQLDAAIAQAQAEGR